MVHKATPSGRGEGEGLGSGLGLKMTVVELVPLPPVPVPVLQLAQQVRDLREPPALPLPVRREVCPPLPLLESERDQPG